MGKRNFPNIIWGRCPVCGGNGDDKTDPGSLYSTNIQSGNGYPLEYYKGELACQICIKRLKADEESLIIADKDQREQEFRASAGFRKTMED